jgi:hypothetical protein
VEDFERYGDYNEYEDDIPKGKNPVLTVIKILIALVCIAVVGVIAFRLVMFNYYPKNIKNIYFTESLTEHYNENGGDIEVLSQSLRAPYDNEKVATFMCDNLIVIPEIGELQVSIRHNLSAFENIKADHGIELSDPEGDNFIFRLYDNTGRVYEAPIYVDRASSLMYHYYKLVFDGVDFGTEAAPTNWIRLEVFVKGMDSDAKPYMIPIYENNEDYSKFSEYEIPKGVIPE